MLFNSFEFLIFLPIVFCLYWFVTNKSLKLQNMLLLVASYVFYGWWDWRFLGLLAFSTLFDYWVGIKIQQTPQKAQRKALLVGSIAINLVLLGFFKYYNFFAQSWVDAWASVGYTMHPWTLKIVLPVGISFYTFQSMSYAIEVYRGKMEPTRDLISYAAYVSFFPQLVAGPIERPYNILPQMLHRRNFSYSASVEGLRLIVWGLFKKVVIADTLALRVNEVYGDYTHYHGGDLVVAAIYFAIQIYADFSGYSSIARGVAKLFGFELMVNFNFPYFSRDIPEFWRRWHISLSSWFRDYIYIPLGGSRVSKPKAIRNVFVIFLVSGFWHGANWTFLIWGGLHALLFIPTFISGGHRKHTSAIVAEGKWLPTPVEFLQMILTFSFVTIAWVFFRAANVAEAVDFIRRMNFDISLGIRDMKYVAILFVCDWIISHNLFAKLKGYRSIRYITYILILFVIIYHIGMNDAGNQFIYFNF